MRSAVTVADLPSRDRVLISVCLAVILVAAWGYLFHLSGQMSVSRNQETLMAGMDMATRQGWTMVDFAFSFLMWTAMMVGMMAGIATPALLLFAAARRRSGQGAYLAVLLFGVGYFAVWVGFSAAAAGAQHLLHEAAMLSPSIATTSPLLTGAILVWAGLYQMTPVKGFCMTKCRNPLAFLLAHWRDGNVGALRMGTRHGLYCLGCCWAVTCVLFAVGVMNLLLVAVLAAFLLYERIGAAGVVMARAGGGVLILLGVLSIAGL